MPSMSKLMPIALVTALLAGCGSRPDVTRGAQGEQGGSFPSPSGSSSPSASGPPGTVFGGDTPPSGASTVIPSPTYTDKVPGACSLLSVGDIVSVVHGNLKLDIQPGKESSGFDELTGAYSGCRMDLTSTFTPREGGIDIIGGHVSVHIQTRGADIYFPPHPGDTEIAGLGQDAILRNGRVYVLLTGEVLTVEVAITTDGTVEETYARDHMWAEQLAALIVGR
jgi:hypothetical protein